MLAAIRVRKSDADSGLILWPQLAQVVDVLLGVDEANILIGGHALILWEIVNAVMSQQLLFRQHFEDGLHSRW